MSFIPGIYNLGDRVITGAMSGEVITEGNDSGASVEYVGDLEGMLAASLEIRFIYGSGGTSGKVYIQTSLNQGSTWIDVVCVTFTTSSLDKVVNLSGLTPKTTAVVVTDGALGDDTCLGGFLGDRWRSKVTTIGTYAGSTSLSVRLVAR